MINVYYAGYPLVFHTIHVSTIYLSRSSPSTCGGFPSTWLNKRSTSQASNLPKVTWDALRLIQTFFQSLTCLEAYGTCRGKRAWVRGWGVVMFVDHTKCHWWAIIIFLIQRYKFVCHQKNQHIIKLINVQVMQELICRVARSEFQASQNKSFWI